MTHPDRSGPIHRLCHVREYVAKGRVSIFEEGSDIAATGLTAADIAGILASLAETDYVETVDDWQNPGNRLDVYHKTVKDRLTPGRPMILYIKLFIDDNRRNPLVILSFKRKNRHQ